MSELDAPEEREQPPPYIIFVVVSLFFLTGLLGFLICHLLKKKGYRCRTVGDLDDKEEEEDEEKLEGNADDNDEHQDTVEQILKCIIENEANMEAFSEMLGNHNICVRHDPRLRKESVACIPSHHHTVHSGTDLNSCHLCAQARTKKGRRPSRTPRFKQRPGEQTVFSVGRFRVTHHDKKLQGGTNPSVGSGDQLDHSQDSEDRKESGYNLRSMFKDVRPQSDTSNGIASNVGKRRKSVTIFGLRRGSDSVVNKAAEGTGKETGGVKFTVQKRPAVLEELSQTDSTVDPLERNTKPNTLLSPDQKAETANTLPEIKNQFWGGSDQFSSALPCMNRDSLGCTAASGPSCLLIPLPMPSAQDLLPENHGDVENFDLPNKNVDDPGPLQTSTPFAPIQRTISGYADVISTNPSECHPSRVLGVIRTPSDLSSSTDIESSNSLALISLGSSPPSASRIKSVSSLSLSNTPTITPKAEISSENTPSEAARNVSTALKAQSQIFSLSKEQELEGIGLPKTQQKTEINRAGILTMPKYSLIDGDFEATSLSSPPYPLNRDRPLSPSSPFENTNITMIKSCNGRERQFSVVTHVEEESSTKDQSSDTSEPGADSEELQTVSDVGQAEGQYGESAETQDNRSTVDKRGDFVESKDIA